MPWKEKGEKGNLDHGKESKSFSSLKHKRQAPRRSTGNLRSIQGPRSFKGGKKGERREPTWLPSHHGKGLDAEPFSRKSLGTVDACAESSGSLESQGDKEVKSSLPWERGKGGMW